MDLEILILLMLNSTFIQKFSQSLDFSPFLWFIQSKEASAALCPGECFNNLVVQDLNLCKDDGTFFGIQSLRLFFLEIICPGHAVRLNLASSNSEFQKSWFLQYYCLSGRTRS